MAEFTNLYHASEVLRHVLETRISQPPSGGVLVAPPPDTNTTNEEIRISLLWVTEHATHRSDGPLRNHDGTTTPPPSTLSLFVLVTTYGEGPSKNADGAHRLLGEVARVLHAEPTLSLPMAGLPGNSGMGKLHVALVPVTPELVEKLFAPLQIKHRPFLFYEIWPVQLRSLLPPGAPTPVVAPGGIRLSGPTTDPRPVLSRVVPSTQAAGGFLRLDGAFTSPVDAVFIGSTRLAGASLVALDPQRSVGVALPAGLPAGVHKVSVAAGPLQSDALDLRVVDPGQRSLDVPQALAHAQGAPLVLTGWDLGSADLVYVWPDGGVFSPADVRTFVPSAVASGSITVALSGLPRGDYRIAARVDLGSGAPAQFTPYIVLELTP
ncbi:Pvc16 family protein [Sorangium cellulosum]|uniref:Pvc16 N-terminal domain-containing protein n=1 Tax=Sorangium cellulosum So0157-2 TaxID=1254432 RepID=S4Y7U5_SORCE|nr:Pvc16 family protein [Sorangium cellulosum]AGP41507.1 hypothetical protein SCE1572_47695 [Sorangium cellulosum So0157-2]